MFTHLMCDACWTLRWPERRAARLAHAPPEPCCFCNATTTSGIFVRADPGVTVCKNEGPQHEGEP